MKILETISKKACAHEPPLEQGANSLLGRMPLVAGDVQHQSFTVGRINTRF
jgi:hypothetical protein